MVLDLLRNRRGRYIENRPAIMATSASKLSLRMAESSRNVYRRCGATISAVSRTNATTTRKAAVEILALNVFGIADRASRMVTCRMAEQRLAELAEHADTRDWGLCNLVPLWPSARCGGPPRGGRCTVTSTAYRGGPSG